MRIDYHVHFEACGYDLAWAQKFFRYAQLRGIDETGIAEHSHAFIEFKELYYAELELNQLPIGEFQRQWLAKNKFKYSLKDYFEFMAELKKKYPVKTGLELCNFRDHEQVRSILSRYNFDYIIGSVHFIKGCGFDFADEKFVWHNFALPDIYEWYVSEAENLCRSGICDILGHPFNIRLFKNFPQFDVEPYLLRAVQALAQANMAIEISTGTFYRYPVKEISPYPPFLKLARQYNIPIILASDAHQPEDCGVFISAAADYARAHGYEELLIFKERQAAAHKIL